MLSLKSVLSRLVAALLLLALMAVLPARAADNNERIFSRERNLVAVAHCSNLAVADVKFRTLLDLVNPANPFKKPLLQLVGPAIFNEALKEINVSHWCEAVLLSLPLEKDNDWVYVLRVKSQKNYVKALIDFGNIRQELQEDGVTRYRQMLEDTYNVFFVTFTADNLLLISRSRKALDITRRLYAFSSRDGLLSNVPEDLRLMFHFSRYLAGSAGVVNELNAGLQRDILRELAGSQARADNPLNLGLGSFLQSINRLLREVAVVDFAVTLQPQQAKARLRLIPTYGGNIHYALSNLPGGPMTVSRFLPATATELCEGRMWKEATGQVLEAMASIVTAMLGREVSDQVKAGAASAYDIFEKANPTGYAMGLVVPENGGKRCGPLWVGLVRWENPKVLRENWKNWLDFFTVGELAEMLAEKGIRLEISHEPLRLPENPDQSAQLRIKLSSLYFNLPGVWGHEQRVMLSLKDNMLVLVGASAPLDALQYDDAQVFMQQLLRETVTGIATGRGGASTPQRNLRELEKAGVMFAFSMHPLRYIQQAFLAEVVWPQPNTPNRLPVPWADYYKEFKSFAVLGQDVTCRLGTADEGVDAELVLPAQTVAQTIRACLGIKAVGTAPTVAVSGGLQR